MRANSSASRLAPPTSAPSMSRLAISSAMFAAFTDPPYWMRTASPVGAVGERGRCAHGWRWHTAWASVGRRRLAGADRPDRLVGDHQGGDLRLGAPGDAGVDLAEHLRLGRPRLALVERLADADDRGHPVLLDGRDLGGDHLVGLAEQLAPLAVAADDVLHVELGEEHRRHLPGERALVLPVAVLGAEGERQVVDVDQRLDAAQVGERRVDADVDRRRGRPSGRGSAASGRSGSPRSGCGASSSCRRSAGGASALMTLRPCRSAARPGRSPSSSSSSDAPPPVDTWSTSVVEAELGEGRGRVAATDDGERLGGRPPPRRPRGCRRRTAGPRTCPSGRSRTRCGRR